MQKQILYFKTIGPVLLFQKIKNKKAVLIKRIINFWIFIVVTVAPVIRVTNQLLGAPLGTNVRLECIVESFPNSVNYWSNIKGDYILSG